MKRYLIAGLLVWVPLGITIWVLHSLVSTLDQTLLLLPEAARPERLIGIRIPGFGVLLAFRDPAGHRRVRRQLLRRAADPLLGRPARPDPLRQVDLLRGQAGQRHAVFRHGQRLPQGGAGGVPARAQLDDRLPHRFAVAGGHQAPRGRVSLGLRADDAESDVGLLHHGAALADARARHERRRRAQVHHLDGRRRAEDRRTAPPGCRPHGADRRRARGTLPPPATPPRN